MADTKYGKRFKQLRLQKGISLDMASSGITSKSSLYYWETGQRNMPFDKVVAMLKRMHIPYEELDTGLNDNYKYLSDIRIAYSTNNNKQLRQIAIDSLEQLQNNPKNKSSLIRAAISCNFLKDSTGELLFSPKNLAYLEDLLSEINEWHYEDVFNFGNTLSLLPAKRTFGLTQLLIRAYAEEKSSNHIQWKYATLNTILNAAITLFKNDYSYAQKLIFELKSLKIDGAFAYEKFCLNFIFELENHFKAKNDSKLVNNFFLA